MTIYPVLVFPGQEYIVNVKEVFFMTGILKRTAGKTVANTLTTFETTEGSARELLLVTVAFNEPGQSSVSPSYVGTDLQVRINSGAGSEYDIVLQTGTSNERYFSYVPASPIVLMDDDHIDVVVPGVGSGIVGAVTIITKAVGY